MRRWLWAATAALCLAAAATADAGDPLVLQLKWLPDAQFAGYFVAEARGFYRNAGLDVTIKPGGHVQTLVTAGAEGNTNAAWRTGFTRASTFASG
jgi:NitT/TauT family transport system substrate-binding protein